MGSEIGTEKQKLLCQGLPVSFGFLLFVPPDG